MANFFDLPRPIREKVYRLHLVKADPITRDQHDEIANYSPISYGKAMPALIAVSKKVEREAAAIYYGENHFDFGLVRSTICFCYRTYTRFLRMVRKATCTWEGDLAGEGFQAIARMKNLQELYIRVDEASMVRQMVNSRTNSRYTIGWHEREPSPQEQLSIVRYPGYSSLSKISGVPHVEFITTLDYKKEEVGGCISGGFLETQLLPKLMGRDVDSIVISVGLEDESFPFLSLPPELRNRIYNVLLDFPGSIRPSTDRPSSTPKKVANRHITPPTPESALSILAVNKQIHDEALGIFYHHNFFVFAYPIQLHAFLLSLSPLRLACLQDLTIYYQNSKSGGINLAGLTFPMLKRLPGLRRLEVILNSDLSSGIQRPHWWTSHAGWKLSGKANPVLLPGIKALFTLRGINDIRVRDLKLEQDLETAKQDKEYPDFSAKSRSACVVKLSEVLDHFNRALAAAQLGKVNKKLLEDPEWHLKEDVTAMSVEEGSKGN